MSCFARTVLILVGVAGIYLCTMVDLTELNTDNAIAMIPNPILIWLSHHAGLPLLIAPIACVVGPFVIAYVNTRRDGLAMAWPLSVLSVICVFGSAAPILQGIVKEWAVLLLCATSFLAIMGVVEASFVRRSRPRLIIAGLGCLVASAMWLMLVLPTVID